MQNQPSPLILTFGVSDPVGALGIQADLGVFAAHGCHGLSVLTALLVADSARVEDMHELDTGWLVDQARALLEDMPVAAFKIGSLAGVEQAAALAEVISDYPDVPLVLDPFLSALPDSGLADEDMLGALRHILVPQCTVLMLSQSELGRMAETWRDGGAESFEADVAELTGSGCGHVLVTGTAGGAGGRANTLFDADGVAATVDWQHVPGSFIGAGGTYSAALAALLGRGVALSDAVHAAQRYTSGALAHAQRFGMGRCVPNKFFRADQAPAG